MLAIIVFRLVGGSSQREEKLILVAVLGSLVQLQIEGTPQAPPALQKKKEKKKCWAFFCGAWNSAA